MKKRTGFTLIELLVVIAIIALLLSIVMPALKRAKKQAQAIICRSNLRQWGMIFALYAQDNEELFPQSVPQNPPVPGGLSAQEAYYLTATEPYYDRAKKVRVCPSTKVLDRIENRSYGDTYTAWGPFDPATSGDWWGTFDAGSYGINDWCSAPPESADDIWGLDKALTWRTITVKGASKIPLYLDCAYLDGFPMELDYPPQWPDDYNDWSLNAMKLFCMDRHSGTINGVFVDLTARPIALKQLWTLKWHRNYNTAGPWTTAGGMRPEDWPEWMKRFKDY
jgi:prepilin-type N-terminal cleavage/methylation domain-containing protein